MVRPCRYGLMAFLPQDRFIGRAFDLYGEYAEAEMSLLARLLPPGGVAVDVGANIGAHTLFFARQVGPGGVVVAFEPQRVLHQLLCTNVALNEHRHVYTPWMALGAQPGTVVVPGVDYAAPGNFGGIAVAAAGSGEPVPMGILDQNSLPACHLIKIDVEGMEPAVLDGAHQTIRRFRPALYVEIDREEIYVETNRRLLDLGYRIWQHVTPLFNPGNFYGNPDNAFDDHISLNALALPRESAPASLPLPEVVAPTDGLDVLRRSSGK